MTAQSAVVGTSHDMPTTPIPDYFPQFLWKYWLSDNLNKGTRHECPFDDHRVHIYDVFQNELTAIRRIPEKNGTIFQDFDSGSLDPECRIALQTAQRDFDRLESETERILDSMIPDIHARVTASRSGVTHRDVGRRQIIVDGYSLDILRKFFTFLRYRNSSNYQAGIIHLRKPLMHRYTRFRDMWRRRVLVGFHAFLQGHQSGFPVHARRFEELRAHCWRFCNADVCLGVASEGQEFMLTPSCFGTLDDDGKGTDPDSCHLFFPVTPTVALYILADLDAKTSSQRSIVLRESRANEVCIEYGLESPSDVHLRNARLLQSNPGYLYFSSLRSAALSISSYEEFRFPKHIDYSRLKQRCRQKSTQEGVTKTLRVRGSLFVTDLTDEVIVLGDSAIAHGTFSDVWKGVWTNPVDNSERVVALKFLRQVMVKNVHEKLLKRLQDEVLAWHRLQHPNIAELCGVFRLMNTIAMVSPWCTNGTITYYLRNINPSADRLGLLIQVASAISYLHNFKPIVVHGDLKGGNILIDDHGHALITDFGLSKVMEDLSDSIKFATSFFAGSTRWMAPELVLALVEDDGRPPPISTSSDVYAFASICLEIATGRLPYPHRSNDHAVTIDIMRGVKPSRGADPLQIGFAKSEPFWGMLDRCWDALPCMRPPMSEVFTSLQGMCGAEANFNA